MLSSAPLSPPTYHLLVLAAFQISSPPEPVGVVLAILVIVFVDFERFDDPVSVLFDIGCSDDVLQAGGLRHREVLVSEQHTYM